MDKTTLPIVKQLLKHLTIFQGLYIGHLNSEMPITDYSSTVVPGHYDILKLHIIDTTFVL